MLDRAKSTYSRVVSANKTIRTILAVMTENTRPA